MPNPYFPPFVTCQFFLSRYVDESQPDFMAEIGKMFGKMK